MRWMVVGASGMLGRELVDMLRSRGEEVVGLGRAELDITSAPQTNAAVAAVGPQVVVNCAAFTRVDDAETVEAEAFAANAVGAANLAAAAAGQGARMVQVSTDYVFDGAGTVPYGENDPLAPTSAYGRTKAAGEWAVQAAARDALVVRTAWLYGANGRCFPRTIVGAGRKGALRVVDDQIGQPTWTFDLADLLVRLVQAQVPGGIYHGTSSGQASWFEFARAAVVSAGMEAQLVSAASSAEYVRPAPRPAYSVLGHDRLLAVGVEPIGNWNERWNAAAAAVLNGV